jgi:hypothetical protein
VTSWHQQGYFQIERSSQHGPSVPGAAARICPKGGIDYKANVLVCVEERPISDEVVCESVYL